MERRQWKRQIISRARAWVACIRARFFRFGERREGCLRLRERLDTHFGAQTLAEPKIFIYRTGTISKLEANRQALAHDVFAPRIDLERGLRGAECRRKIRLITVARDEPLEQRELPIAQAFAMRGQPFIRNTIAEIARIKIGDFLIRRGLRTGRFVTHDVDVGATFAKPAEINAVFADPRRIAGKRLFK